MKKGIDTDEGIKLIAITEQISLKPLGRAGFVDGKFAADHAAPGLVMTADCHGSVKFNITAAKKTNFSVTVDGKTTKNVTVAAGTSNFVAASRLTEGTHTIEIVNET